VPNLTDRTFSLEPLVHSDHCGCDTPGPPIYLNALYQRRLESYRKLVECRSAW
jgi:hypothetical protein